MKLFTKTALMVMPLALIINAGAVSAANWDVTVTNLTHASSFTPLILAAHAHDAPIFSVGTTASTSLQHLAECGHTVYIVTDLGGTGAETIENPNGGLLGAGATSTSARIVTTATHLTAISMIIPSNDAFMGLSQHIPDFNSATGANNTHTYYVMAHDAGTEGNDEIINPNGGCTMNDGAYIAGGVTNTGGTGVVAVGGANPTLDSNTTVHIHRGILGDLSATGGVSDLDSSIHRWQNPVAKVVVVVSQ